MLEDHSIIAWLVQKGIKTETGNPIDLRDGLYLFDIFRDFSQNVVIMKGAQVRLTTTQILKAFFWMNAWKMEGIYTLPTVTDAQEMSKSKITRLIEQNPCLKDLVKEMDSMGQKRIGGNVLYIRGTWTEKSAMMFPSDMNMYDEVDASKQDTLEQYSTRLQHSKYKIEHWFGHPSAEGFGVHKKFLASDRKHWFSKCEACQKEQYLSWPESIDPERKCYQCKFCKAELSDEDRRCGRWVRQVESPISGYWVPLLICPWVSAAEILKYHKEKSEPYFFNKVLGLPYVGSGNKVTWEMFSRGIKPGMNLQEGRIVIGVDTGTTIWYVCANEQGFFHYDKAKDYTELEALLGRWPTAVAVFDQGGDLIAPRKLQEKYPGRVFLCHYRANRKTQELITWGKGPEEGNVVVDRNRMIQLIVDEMADGRVVFNGTETDWYDVYLHWANMYRVEEEDALGVPVKRWERSGDDHLAHAMLYCRVGLERFIGQGTGQIFGPKKKSFAETGLFINPDGTATLPGPDIDAILASKKQKLDWRNC